MGVMGRLALGLALVWLDLDVVGLALLADPVGWAVADLALRRVGHRHPMLMVAAGCSGVAVVGPPDPGGATRRGACRVTGPGAPGPVGDPRLGLPPREGPGASIGA